MDCGPARSVSTSLSGKNSPPGRLRAPVTLAKNIPNPTDSFIEREFARVRVRVRNEWMSCQVREEKIKI